MSRLAVLLLAVSLPATLGYPALAGLVFAESVGVPLPGETALILAGAHLWLPGVIAVAAVAATLGDTVGYWIGRRGGRALLLKGGLLAGHRRAALARADRYFERYGAITVFCARWLPGLRFAGAVSAGSARMSWGRFAPANAAGGLAWAASVGGVAHLAGPRGSVYIAVVAWSVATILVLFAWARHRSRHAVATP
jgi:membrane protein DedA with SNARE-associated domain